MVVLRDDGTAYVQSGVLVAVCEGDMTGVEIVVCHGDMAGEGIAVALVQNTCTAQYYVVTQPEQILILACYAAVEGQDTCTWVGLNDTKLIVEAKLDYKGLGSEVGCTDKVG